MTASETDMQAEDVRALRQSAVPTAIAGAACVVGGSIAAGFHGALGALLALVVVTAFFAVSTFAVGRAAKSSPSLMMGVALGTYILKIIALMVLARLFINATFFDGRVFGFSAIGLVLVWSAMQVRTMATSKMLYVEPRP